MKLNFKKRFVEFGGAAVLVALFLVVFTYEKNSMSDPDRFYHFAISKQMVESGRMFLRELPQVEGLGWDKFFTEKEFLFHQITALAYRLGQEEGVVRAVWVLALAGVLIFYFHASRRIGALPAFLLAGIFFGSPALLWRLVMLRPHVLAITCFVAVLISALKKSRVGFCFSIFLFAISYHAFYMPLVVIGASLFAHYFTRPGPREGEWNFYAWGIAGWVMGIVLNPYFPANLISGAQIALIPRLMGGELSGVAFGDELYPVASNIFLVGFSLPLAIFLVAVWRMSRDHRQNGAFSYPTLFLVPLTFLYLLITFQSRRGGEYLLPVAAFLAVELWVSFSSELDRKAQRLVTGGAVLLFAWYAVAAAQVLGQEWRAEEGYAWRALRAAEAIPAGKDVKVFNCEWDSSPYLYYARPRARFVDIMDPSLLFFANRDAHRAREQLKAGEVGDAYGLLKNAFKADYVYCRNLDVVSTLDRDPRFRRVFPVTLVGKDASMGIFVYELKPEPESGYTKSFELSYLPAKEEDFRQLGPRDAVSPVKAVQLTFTGYLDLARIFEEEVKAVKEGESYCALARPKDMSSLVGARYLSLGGGRNIRLWKNGVPWFQSEYSYLKAGMHQHMIPLEQPLKETDRLELVVCSAKSARFWGLSLLGLTEAKFAELCGWKRALEQKETPPFDFQYGRRNQTCLGDLATKVVSPALR